MNRNKLKRYAPQARRDFIKAVTDRAAFYGLSKEHTESITERGDVALVAGKPFPRSVAKKRKRLEEQISRDSFDQVMEAMAYTWFNRFVAIRYMELHGYLDHGYRVLSTTNHTNNTNGIPDILKYAEHVDLPGVDREKAVELKLAGSKDEELYRMLLIAQCNALHKAMPFLFEWINDATELLLPENLLHSDSLIRKLVNEIPEEEWQEVEIIGWLYQFYISEKKNQVIGKVVKSEDIPAATQLFTPNWIVKYMVQNTLGRQWMATYHNSSLKQQMEFYIEPAEHTPEVQEQLKAITPDNLNPEELTLLDPACGSGHILVEAYDLLKAIYQERGYRRKDIPRLILEKNLYGLEIDDRSAQLAAFALMMKARADDRHIFENGTQPHVLAIQESKGLDAGKMTEALNEPILKVELPPREFLFEEMEEERAPLFSRKNLSVKGDIALADVAQLIDLFEHGKTFGSLIRVPEEMAEKLSTIVERVEDVMAYGDMFGQAAARLFKPLVEQARILGRKYDAVVTNPPYMGGKGLNGLLKGFLKDNYADVKSDLFSAFIVRNTEVALPKGQLGFMSPFVWMFISSYEKLRSYLIDQKTLTSLVQLEYSGFAGATVPICTFTVENAHHPSFRGGYVRLSDFRGAENQGPKTLEAIKNPSCGWFYCASSDDFKKIPGSPIAYWISPAFTQAFDKFNNVGEIAAVRKGLVTLHDARFIRNWYEMSWSNIQFGTENRAESKLSKRKWFPINKGGGYRKWYGFNESVINWANDGQELKNFIVDKYNGGSYTKEIRSEEHYFSENITWGSITSGPASFRYTPNGFLFSSGGSCIFPEGRINSLLLLLNSKISATLLKALTPTLNYVAGDISRIPVCPLQDIPGTSADTLLEHAKQDWDSFETSWDFTSLPLMRSDYREPRLQATYAKVRAHWREKTLDMKRLEEENNRTIIEGYGLQDDLTPEVPLNEITLTCNPYYRYGGDGSEKAVEALLMADTIKEFISYTVGCMMGRYSLDKPGLIYAHSGNQGFGPNQYETFPADQDGIIPITDTDWFEDDAANRVIEFIGVAWPKEHLEENVKFVADSLGPKREESSRDTIRRYLTTGFYKHHMKMYKKRPIYWLFSSGKQRAFQCLVYLHRYNAGTLSRMRTEYVIPLQSKMSARINQLKDDFTAATSTSHRKKLEREQDKLVKQQTELQTFDEKLRHYADKRISFDLDDGVKVNYGKFGDLLAEVKAVTGKKAE